MVTGLQSRIRLAALFLALTLGALTVTIAARAVVTVTTPNAAIIGYNLAAGAVSGAITPPASQSVLVMGVCNTVGFRGVGHMSLLRVPASFLEWSGVNSPANAVITSGFSGALGTRMLQIDFSGGVWLEVRSPDTFRVHNLSAGARSGNVTMIW